MKRNPNFILRAIMLVLDLSAIIAAFGIAYFLRVHFDARPFYFAPDTWEFVRTAIMLIPMWILVLFICGVYQESNYLYRGKIVARLFLVSMIGVMCVLAAAFFLEETVFPSRIVAIYALIFSFIFLVVEREIIRAIRKILIGKDRAMVNVIVIGNDANTAVLLEQISSDKNFGYHAVAVVSNDEFVPEAFKNLKYRSLSSALKTTVADVIIQTDEADTDKVYGTAIDHHMGYMFVPNQEILLSKMSQMQVVGTQPIIFVRTTPLIGWARLVKRLSDLVLGGILLILATPFMFIIAVISKLSSPRAPIFYSEKRLTRFGQKCRIYKFRTIKPEANGLTPEQAFTKMGRPELIAEYRAGGDRIDNDPRFTRLGRFLRAASLDELPQFWNILRGDISLVGPRALQPGELEKYPNRNLILSAKSGLTGLAQVSGRRNISFEERRSLDIFYIQNWSLGLDMQIILRTVLMVLTRRGAE